MVGDLGYAPRTAGPQPAVILFHQSPHAGAINESNMSIAPSCAKLVGHMRGTAIFRLEPYELQNTLLWTYICSLTHWL